MPVRSVNLKMILDRGANGESLRKNLWLTHCKVNEAVSEIERILLLCRGRSYYVEDNVLVENGTVEVEALAFARKVQEENGKPNEGENEEILSGLRNLYEAMVPSSLLDEKGKPREGNAQEAGGFAGPLMDRDSTGLQSIFEKIIPEKELPSWISDREAGKKGWKQASEKWLESKWAKKLQAFPGRPLTWMKNLKEEKEWQQAFVDDQEKKRMDSTSTLIRRLKEDLGLLPLFAPPMTSQFTECSSALTPWDRLALRLAVGHLLSWESWNYLAHDEYQKTIRTCEQHNQRLSECGAIVDHLRRYEAIRHEELRRVALVDEDNPFRIGARSIRMWERVREQWLKASCVSYDDRLAVLAELQGKSPRSFGDPALYRWLAEDSQEELWRNQDPLPILTLANSADRILRRKREWALYTPPDSRTHPRWTNYEPQGGNNLRNYSITIDGNALSLNLPLLKPDGSGLGEHKFSIGLAPSSQVETPFYTSENLHVCSRRSSADCLKMLLTRQATASNFSMLTPAHRETPTV